VELQEHLGQEELPSEAWANHLSFHYCCHHSYHLHQVEEVHQSIRQLLAKEAGMILLLLEEVEEESSSLGHQRRHHSSGCHLPMEAALAETYETWDLPSHCFRPVLASLLNLLEEVVAVLWEPGSDHQRCLVLLALLHLRMNWYQEEPGQFPGERHPAQP